MVVYTFTTTLYKILSLNVNLRGYRVDLYPALTFYPRELCSCQQFYGLVRAFRTVRNIITAKERLFSPGERFWVCLCVGQWSLCPHAVRQAPLLVTLRFTLAVICAPHTLLTLL